MRVVQSGGGDDFRFREALTLLDDLLKSSGYFRKCLRPPMIDDNKEKISKDSRSANASHELFDDAVFGFARNRRAA